MSAAIGDNHDKFTLELAGVVQRHGNAPVRSQSVGPLVTDTSKQRSVSAKVLEALRAWYASENEC